VLFQKPPTTIKGFFYGIKMASCEKCWCDAYYRSIEDPMIPQAVHYQNLIEERKENPCTAEEQAGIDAGLCSKCGKKTVHQYAKVCCNCGSNEKILTIHDPEFPVVVIVDQVKI